MHAADDLLDYYQRELAYLREQGGEFARKHPKVAARLSLGDAESPDPHTERLIEANAFLAARVHRDLDREFPQVAAALLDHLCPSLNQPVPAMSVAQFGLDPTQGKVTAGLRVPRHTVLAAAGLPPTPRTDTRPGSGTADTPATVCRLRTAWDTLLWPVQVVDARISDGRTLHLRLRCDEGNDLAELDLDRLRLHLHGEGGDTLALYELLAGSVTGLAVHTADGQRHPLGVRHWHELGYADDEGVLPRPLHAPPAYGLLQEYFAFPRKFLFFEVSGLRGRLGRGPECELVLTLDGALERLGRLDAGVLRTNCVPIINLFPRTSEPLRLDARQHEQRLVADHLHEATTEIHSIEAVFASDPNAARPRRIAPFAALDPADSGASPGTDGIFWTARREPSLRADLPGSDLWLALVDPGHAPATAMSATPSAAGADPVVYAQLLCTNRRLAEQLPAGTRLRPEGLSSALRAHCLYQPTPQREAPRAAEAMWRLVGLLRLNHRSLVGADAGPAGSTEGGAEALRSLLRLFAGDHARDLAQIRGVRGLQARPCTARIGTDAWRGHCRGTEIELRFDEDAYAGGSPLLLAGVLARFLALYTTLNSFVRLTVRRRDGLWKQWDPISGRQALL